MRVLHERAPRSLSPRRRRPPLDARLAGGSGGGSSWSSRASLPAGLASTLGRGPLCSVGTCLPGVPPQPLRRVQGLGRGSRSPRVRLPPWTRSAPASEPGLGRSSPQPISNRLDAVGGMLGRRGPSCLSGLQFLERRSLTWEPQRKTGVGAGYPHLHLRGRGTVWVGPAPAACPQVAFSAVLPATSLPSPALPVHRCRGVSTQGWGKGCCWSQDAQGLLASWTRGAELERK